MTDTKALVERLDERDIEALMLAAIPVRPIRINLEDGTRFELNVSDLLEVYLGAIATIEALEQERDDARNNGLVLVEQQNKCGDLACEEARLDAAMRCLRGGPTHRATADVVNASEDAWRDAASTEAVMRQQATARAEAAERELSEARARLAEAEEVLRLVDEFIAQIAQGPAECIRGRNYYSLPAKMALRAPNLLAEIRGALSTVVRDLIRTQPAEADKEGEG